MAHITFLKQATIAILGVVVGLSIGVGLQAHSAPDPARPLETQVVRAHKFQLLDDKGKVCAGIEQVEGNTLIHLNDDKDRQRLAIGLSASGDSYIDLEDTSEKTRAQLNVWKDGTPHLTLLDIHQKELLGAAINKEGQAEIRLSGKEPQISLLNEKGDPRLLLGLAQKGYAIPLPDALHVAGLKQPGGFLFISDDKGNHAEMVATDGESEGK